MSFIDDLADHIETNIPSVFNSSNLKIGELVRLQYGVYMIANTSPQPDMYTGIEEYEIDFWVRDPNSSQAWDYLEELYNFYHQKAHYEIGAYHIYFTNAQSQIIDMDRDAEGNKLLRLPIRWIAGISVS